ncbi:MAG: DUF4198 domain-containing protein [Paracoccaceae bacterium]|nr:DUF4198 domain-containing protein [Paracoccaceae bacterium]
MPGKLIKIPLIAVLLMLHQPLAALSHEFWIEPERWQFEPGTPISADLMVGQMLRGEPYPYLSNHFTRFSVAADRTAIVVAGIEGDLPALSRVAAEHGLNTITHQTVAFRATYDDWSVFRRYLSEEGLDSFAEVHRSRGLPETGFSERYTRYAKALVQSGPVTPGDRDTAQGLTFEMVVGENPYLPGLDRLPVTLLWQGSRVANHQITILEADGEKVSRKTIRTDSTGAAEIQTIPGRSYLLNAVRLEAVDDVPVVWQSHWASLTFGTMQSFKPKFEHP